MLWTVLTWIRTTLPYTLCLNDVIDCGVVVSAVQSFMFFVLCILPVCMLRLLALVVFLLSIFLK